MDGKVEPVRMVVQQVNGDALDDEVPIMLVPDGYFTWDMVEALRSTPVDPAAASDAQIKAWEDGLNAIADAIERILPPRDMEAR